jgi:hypothetical protein
MIMVGQFGSVLFTGFISIQAVLVLRYRCTVGTMRKVERYFLILGSLLPFVAAVYAASIGAIHPTTGGICFVNANPHFCLFSYLGWCRAHKSWGERVVFYNLVITGVILMVLLMVLISMVLLFLTARSQERRAAQWSMTAQEGRAQKAVVKTASLYLCTYILAPYPPRTALVRTANLSPLLGYFLFFLFCPSFHSSIYYSHLRRHLLYHYYGDVYEKWWRIGNGNRTARSRVLQCLDLFETVPSPCKSTLRLPTKSWYWCGWEAPTSSTRW